MGVDRARLHFVAVDVAAAVVVVVVVVVWSLLLLFGKLNSKGNKIFVSRIFY